MARNAIESDFQSSKMAAGGHFVKNYKKRVAYESKMARNALESDFQPTKMAAGGPFEIKSCLLISKWRETVYTKLKVS